jgi:hypothetical protein
MRPATILRVGGCVCVAAAALAALVRTGLVYRFDPTAPATTRFAVTTPGPAALSPALESRAAG